MRTKGTFVHLALAFALVHLCTAQTVLINEFMSNNHSSFQDMDGDFSDWIELYNPSDTAINLFKYGLSDDKEDLRKWLLPDLLIRPQGYVLIFASGKDVSVPNEELHTNFSIRAVGESLCLTNSNGDIIDQTSSVILSDNQVYTRVPDGGENWFIQNIPTPTNSNSIPNELTVSHASGFYQTPFDLTVDPLWDDSVRFTLNGDLPTPDSEFLNRTIRIDRPETSDDLCSLVPSTPDQDLISYKAWQAPVNIENEATVLRCATFRNGIRTSAVYTRVFFIGKELSKRHALPVVSIVVEKEDFFDEKKGIYVPGKSFDDIDAQWTGNYFEKGKEWERGIHITYFDQDRQLGFSQDAGVRIHGGKTRQAAQKSLRIYARDGQGKERFDFQLLPSREVDSYKSFILRTSMASWHGETVITDVFAHSIASNLDLEYQEFQPVVLYLNGEYWGIHTLRDRIDENYVAYCRNILEENVEFWDWNNRDYNDLLVFIRSNDINDPDVYEQVRSELDIDNYIDYLIVEQYLSNYDWPANNFTLWREMPNGKWRWILYDLDAAFGDPEYNMIEHCTADDPDISWPNTQYSTFLFRNLIRNDSFLSAFISRYEYLLENLFKPDALRSRLDSIKQLYAPEIKRHIQRWHYPACKGDWELDIKEVLVDFIEQRPCFASEHLIEFFDPDDFNFVCDTIDYPVTDEMAVTIYPNPNFGNFMLRNSGESIECADLSVYSMDGRIVHTEKDFSIKSNSTKYVDLTGVPRETYLLKLNSKQHSLTKRIAVLSN